MAIKVTFIAIAAVIGCLAILCAVFTAVFFRMGMSRYLKRSDRLNPSAFDKRGRPENYSDIPKKLDSLKDEMRACAEWMRNSNFEEHAITSFDGLKLHGRFLPADGEMKGIILMMHGFRSNPVHDFSCAVKCFHEMGYGCFLPYQRAHGDSEGKYITFGAFERFDCRDWAAFIEKRYPGYPLLLDGVSMGATTVLSASGLDLPSNVKGIIADCGFTSPYDIFEAVMKNAFKLPKFPLFYTVRAVTRLIAGFDLEDFSTVEAVKKNSLPILFAHGEADDFVPCEMSRRGYEAARSCCNATLFTVPGAGHGLSFLIDREGYLRILDRFLRDCINTGGTFGEVSNETQ